MIALSRAIHACTGSLLRLLDCAVQLDLACARAKVQHARSPALAVPLSQPHSAVGQLLHELNLLPCLRLIQHAAWLGAAKPVLRRINNLEGRPHQVRHCRPMTPATSDTRSNLGI